MAPERRRLVILLLMLAIVVVVAIVRFWPTSAATGTASAAGAVPARRGATASRVTAPAVHLPALGQDRPHPESAGGRDLFRFKPKPSPQPQVASRPPVTASAPAGPPPPPQIPPIALRFIGLVEAPAQSQRIAILSDGRGIYQGREGDIIEGRYQILHIGVESIDMAYVDGTGRQTIRLSGS
jgi:hypothetical protein